MLRLNINLPKYRLSLNLSKKRGKASIENEPLLPTLEELRNARSGNKFSRLFRHIFEQNRIRKILGGNLALALIATSILPGNIKANDIQTEQSVIVVNETPVTTTAGIRYPLRKIKINQGYRFFHSGVDFEGVTGDEITAVMGGKVSNIERSKFLYGNAVFIDHGNGYITLYAHLSKIDVKEGDVVTNFTKIGEVGSTGRSTGDHLHFEIHKDGKAINPMSVLPSLK